MAARASMAESSALVPDVSALVPDMSALVPVQTGYLGNRVDREPG